MISRCVYLGSGGIWKVAAMKEAGGWDYRTTAEDMDLAIRASLEGWKLVYVGNIEVIWPVKNFHFFSVLTNILMSFVIPIGEKWAS